MGTVRELNSKNATPSNGKPQTPAAELPKLEETKPLPAAATIKPEPRQIVQEQKPIEDRFLKLDELHALRIKYEKLKETQEKLNKFKTSNTGRADNITLSADNGISFSTYNPEVFTKIVEWLKEDIAQKLQQTEAQIIL